MVDLISGYKEIYDPFPVLARLEEGDHSALNELWENLYHQGDVASASYAAVPRLVQLGQLSLVAAIEVGRRDPNNPEIPSDLAEEYGQAIQEALQSTPNDVENLLGYYCIHASVHGHGRLAKAIHLMSPEELLSEYG